MTSTIKLYIDIQAQPGRLVGGLNGATPPPLTGFYQGSKLNLRVYPVRPTGTVSTGLAYEQIPIGDFGDIKVAIGTRAGTSTIYAQAGAGTSDTFGQQATADANGEKDYFYGTLNLNTTAANNAIGSNESISAFFEIQLSIAGNYRIAYQQAVTLFAAVIDPSGAVSLPTAASEYYTKAELDALFVPWDSSNRAANAGKTLIFLSPDSGSTRELGVDNSKAPIDNLT